MFWSRRSGVAVVLVLVLGLTVALAVGCGEKGKDLSEVTSDATPEEGQRDRSLVPGGENITEDDIEAARKKADELEESRGG